MHGSDFHEVPFLNCEIRALKTGVKVKGGANMAI